MLVMWVAQASGGVSTRMESSGGGPIVVRVRGEVGLWRVGLVCGGCVEKEVGLRMKIGQWLGSPRDLVAGLREGAARSGSWSLIVRSLGWRIWRCVAAVGELSIKVGPLTFCYWGAAPHPSEKASRGVLWRPPAVAGESACERFGGVQEVS